jgi:hypothetical protein
MNVRAQNRAKVDDRMSYSILHDTILETSRHRDNIEICY